MMKEIVIPNIPKWYVHDPDIAILMPGEHGVCGTCGQHNVYTIGRNDQMQHILICATCYTWSLSSPDAPWADGEDVRIRRPRVGELIGGVPWQE